MIEELTQLRNHSVLSIKQIESKLIVNKSLEHTSAVIGILDIRAESSWVQLFVIAYNNYFCRAYLKRNEHAWLGSLSSLINNKTTDIANTS